MLDHVFTDAIGAIRDALTEARLERQAFDERFTSDVLIGDLTWETSYGLPGEGMPPRVEAHITFAWPSWSQTAYRKWYLEEESEESPGIEMEIAFRVQRLAGVADVSAVLALLPSESPHLGEAGLLRSAVHASTSFGADSTDTPSHATEVAYLGTYVLNEETLADGSSATLDEHFGLLGAWISSRLVALGDLRFDYLPSET
jgi:hypothetical protein